MYVLGVDGGTESLRAGVFDSSGVCLCSVFAGILRGLLEPRAHRIPFQS